MTASVCLFCDHALDGRSKKFCTTCLPPLGEWDDEREYAKRYHILRCAVGIGTEGMERCKIPKTHGAYTPPGPIHGPKLSDRPIYGPRKVNTPAKFTPEQAEAVIQAEADKLFPRRQTYEAFFVYHPKLKTPPATPRLLTETGGLPNTLCVACQRPFERGSYGLSGSYCATCRVAVSGFYQRGGPGPVFVPRPCLECDTMITPRVGLARVKLCSDECRRRRSNRKYHEGKPGAKCDLTPCEECGDTPCRPFKQAQNQSLCNRCRFVKRSRQRNKTQARRLAVEKAGDDIGWRELGERDGWRCHICSGRVLKRSGTAHVPNGATVDHLVPIADDGSHTWDNVALAHRSCNTSRGAGGTAQLRLTG